MTPTRELFYIACVLCIPAYLLAMLFARLIELTDPCKHGIIIGMLVLAPAIIVASFTIAYYCSKQ